MKTIIKPIAMMIMLAAMISARANNFRETNRIDEMSLPSEAEMLNIIQEETANIPVPALQKLNILVQDKVSELKKHPRPIHLN